MLIIEFSAPAKLALWCSETKVWVSCWVVRSYIQTPSRDMARKEKSTTLKAIGGGVLLSGGTVLLLDVGMIHRITTTGICQRS